jgi:hypothetical protein
MADVIHALFFQWQSLVWEIPAAYIVAMSFVAERYQRSARPVRTVVREFYNWAEHGL